MLFQNLKAIGEELSEICVLFCKYIYIFIYIEDDILSLTNSTLLTADDYFMHKNMYLIHDSHFPFFLSPSNLLHSH
jgi:hypothetical protein